MFALLFLFFACGYVYYIRSKIVTTQEKCIVAIEGNMASGKTTLCKQLQGTMYQGKRISTFLEEMPQSFLSQFYLRPKTYAFALQLHTLEKRLNSIWYAHHDKVNQILFLDRSTIGDFVFALKHYLDGNMSYTELQIYLEQSRAHSFQDLFFNHFHSIVYLHTEPSICKRRVQKRGMVDKNVDLSYLDDIDHLHFYLILALLLEYPQIKIKILNSNQLDTIHSAPCAQLKYVPDDKKVVQAFSLDHSVPLRADSFINIPAQYHYGHTQEWKNEIMKKLSNSELVYVYKGDTSKLCLLHWIQENILHNLFLFPSHDPSK